MKYLFSSLLILTFLLGACSETSAPQTLAAEIPGVTGEPVTNETPTGSNIPAREAVLSEIENTVLVRTSASGEAMPASNGAHVLETDSVETGDNSRARLDLVPDGTIVRLAPNTSFVLNTLASDEGTPQTKLQLLFGQVFILLNGGSLDVETPSGVASVKGSLMSVTYSKTQNRTTATCLEGHCVVTDEDEELKLTEGQAADFFEGELEDQYREMSFEELGLWVLDNPDLEEHIEEFPDLPDLPDDFDWNYNFYDDPQFDFFFDPEYDPSQENFDEGYPTEEGYSTQDPEATLVPESMDTPIPEEGDPASP
ncbi:MAG: FecR family protein [Chloroflexi bacterium]|nr:FecR family protein [Chloroflexota bacterium]